MQVRFGVESLLSSDQLGQIVNTRVGLVTNNAATTSPATGLLPSRLALQRAGLSLTVLFSPEHGLGAGAADGANISNCTDRLTGLPVNSLYGTTYKPGMMKKMR